jgi:hypothetical protein
VATGACGEKVARPLVIGARVTSDITDVDLFAGGAPRQVHVGTGLTDEPLYTPDDRTYVAAMARDSKGIVMLVTGCTADAGTRIIRASFTGETTQIGSSSKKDALKLIGGGSQVWVEVTSHPNVLRATDGSSNTITLPNGFVPIGASGTKVVGAGPVGGILVGPIQIFDITSDTVTEKLGPPGDPISVAVDNGWLVWSPGICGGRCAIHRYQLSTGKTHTAKSTGAVHWDHSAAISADGRHAAAPDRSVPISTVPEYASLSPGGGGPVGGVDLIDLDQGTVTALPGLAYGRSQTPSLAFSPNSKWLTVALSDGQHTLLLLYTSDGQGPFDSNAVLPGPVTDTAPLVISPHAAPEPQG